MKELRVGDTVEYAIERADCPPERWKSLLANETVAVIGYGVQGRGQSLNLRDHGVHVLVGQRSGGKSRELAIEDGWSPGTTLFDPIEAAQRGSIVLNLLSDAGQKETWPALRRALSPGKALCFAHGFSIVYGDQTGVCPDAGIDVILVAPKGSGTTLRRMFVEGRGLNSSIAVHRDATGRARDRAIALGFAIGSGFLFETTFEKEVFADLTGERGALLGAIYGLWAAQYDVLRARGHSPIEAFNESVEEATQSLYPLIAEKGMDWMYANASTTAQRGALDWFPRFRDALRPVFDALYDAVAKGEETRIALAANSRADYRARLDAELKAVAESEMWQAGSLVRKLRLQK